MILRKFLEALAVLESDNHRLEATPTPLQVDWSLSSS